MVLCGFKFPDKSGHVSNCRNNMADDREGAMDGIRETDLNDDMISGAIGANATTSIDFEEDDPTAFSRHGRNVEGSN